MTLSIHNFDEEWKAWALCLYLIRTNSDDDQKVSQVIRWIKNNSLENDKYMNEMELEIFHTFLWWAKDKFAQ